jgi:hypothetical protein
MRRFASTWLFRVNLYAKVKCDRIARGEWSDTVVEFGGGDCWYREAGDL